LSVGVEMVEVKWRKWSGGGFASDWQWRKHEPVGEMNWR